jgi:hypothetical protein
MILLLPIVPILLVTIICTILMQFLKFAKFKNAFKIITTVIILLMVVIFETNLNSNVNVDGGYNGEYILNMSESINNKIPYYLKIATDAIENENIFSQTIAILYFSLINIVFTIGVICGCDKLYLKGVYYNINSEKTREVFKRKVEKYRKSSSYCALVKKEIKNLFRNITYFLQCVLPAILMPCVILFMTLNSNVESLKEITSGMPDTIKIIREGFQNPSLIFRYFSTISRMPIGQFFTQMPQAIHLEVVPSAGCTITFIGQASTHLPQEVHSFLLIMYTPVLGFWVIAPASQTLAHLPHWMQVIGLAPLPFATI